MRVSFVFRSGNPLFYALAARLGGNGLLVDIREVPREVSTEALDDVDRIREIVGDLGGIVICDRTLQRVSRSLNADAICLYDMIASVRMLTTDRGPERLLAPVKAVVEEIVSLGRHAVVLPAWLGDHIDHRQTWPAGLLDRARAHTAFAGPGRLAIGDWALYALLVSEELNLPIVACEDFMRRDGIVVGDVEQALGKLGVPVESAALLVDHHAASGIKGTGCHHGLRTVESVLICPCCVGLGAWSQAHAEEGLKLFPLQYVHDMDVLSRHVIERVSTIAV